jgi:hypothetical protein
VNIDLEKHSKKEAKKHPIHAIFFRQNRKEEFVDTFPALIATTKRIFFNFGFR